jgi:hypothetical protein
MPFAGGIMQHGYQCGMLWGAALAAGAEAYRRFGPGPKAEAASIRAAGALVEAFRTRHGEINCFEITHIDKSSTPWEMIKFFLIKGGTVGCIKMAGWYAPLAQEEIEKAFAEEGAGAPASPNASEPLPESCAALLAHRMGESEEHATMASGLSGGIGLCGGACGALGTAIWLLGMQIGREKEGKPKYEDHVRDLRSQEIIDRFLRATDFKFECSEIVGRTFEDVEDHAAYVRERGCSELMDVLAGRAPSEPST